MVQPCYFRGATAVLPKCYCGGTTVVLPRYCCGTSAVRLVKGICTLNAEAEQDFHADDQPEASLELLKLEAARHQLGDIFDATTGQLLKGHLVAEAKSKKMEYFKSKEV